MTGGVPESVRYPIPKVPLQARHPYPTAPAAASHHQASTQLLAQVDDRPVWPVRHLMVGSGHHRKASDAIADVAVEGIALPKTSARLLVIPNR